MRISTSQIYDNSIRSILSGQGDLVDLQQQLASGKKLLRPSDDPVGGAKVLRLTEEIDQIEQYKRNNNLLKGNLEQEESVLTNVNRALNRARVLAIQSGSGVISAIDRKAIGIEIGEIRDQVFDLMNSRNANGEFIFAGFQSNAAAFVFDANATGNKYTFQGDEGFNEIAISDSVKIQANNSGKEVFEKVPARLTADIFSSVGTTSQNIKVGVQSEFDQFHKQNYDPVVPGNNQIEITVQAGNTVQIRNIGSGAILANLPFTQGEPFQFNGLEISLEGPVGSQVNFQLNQPENKNPAETLNDLFLALDNEDISDANFAEALADALVGLDNGLTSVANTTSAIGGRANVAESVLGSILDLEITTKGQRSIIEDVDYAEAVSELRKQETALQAAQSTFSRVTGLSLFNFLN